MFALVVFFERNDVAVVPVSWIKGSQCAWPNGKDVPRLARTLQSPKPEWTWHEAQIKSLYASYDEARRYERRLEETSNLDTTEDEDLGNCRKLRKRQKLEISHTDLPDRDSSDEDWSTFKCLNFPLVPFSQNGQECSSTQCTTDMSVVTEKKNESQCTSDMPVVIEERNDPPAEQYTILAENKLVASTSVNQSNKKIGNNEGRDFTNSRILREILFLKMALKEHTATLGFIMETLNTLLERTSQPTFSRKSKDLPVPLPLENYEDLLKLEEELADDEFKEQLCGMMAQSGGINLGNTVRRILTRLMSNQVAMLFSWLGAKEKMSFCNLNLSKIIFDAVRKYVIYEGIADNCIEIVIKDWLRHAKARSQNDKGKNN